MGLIVLMALVVVMSGARLHRRDRRLPSAAALCPRSRMRSARKERSIAVGDVPDSVRPVLGARSPLVARLRKPDAAHTWRSGLLAAPFVTASRRSGMDLWSHASGSTGATPHASEHPRPRAPRERRMPAWIRCLPDDGVEC